MRFRLRRRHTTPAVRGHGCVDDSRSVGKPRRAVIGLVGDCDHADARDGLDAHDGLDAYDDDPCFAGRRSYGYQSAARQ